MLNLQSILAGKPVIEGVLVRGSTDFVWDRQQQRYKSHLCQKVDPADRDCRGEDVTRVSYILDTLQLHILPGVDPFDEGASGEQRGLSDQQLRDRLLNILKPQ